MVLALCLGGESTRWQSQPPSTRPALLFKYPPGGVYTISAPCIPQARNTLCGHPGAIPEGYQPLNAGLSAVNIDPRPAPFQERGTRKNQSRP